MDGFDEIKSEVKELRERQEGLDRRLLTLEVGGAERHSAMLAAISNLNLHLDARIARMERVMWWCIAFMATGFGGMLLQAIKGGGA